MPKIKVVAKRPDSPFYVTNLSDSLENLQKFVGGYIEVVAFDDGILMVCNEEGKLQGLPYNFTLRGDPIMGDVFFCGSDGEDFTDVPERFIDYVKDLNVMTIDGSPMFWRPRHDV